MLQTFDIAKSDLPKFVALDLNKVQILKTNDADVCVITSKVFDLMKVVDQLHKQVDGLIENQSKKDANSVCEQKDGVLRVDFPLSSTQSQSLSTPKAKDYAFSHQKENNHTTYDDHTFQVNKKKI